MQVLSLKVLPTQSDVVTFRAYGTARASSLTAKDSVLLLEHRGSPMRSSVKPHAESALTAPNTGMTQGSTCAVLFGKSEHISNLMV